MFTVFAILFVALCFAGLGVLLWWLPGIVAATLAKSGWFFAFVGEMSAAIVERRGKFYQCYLSVHGFRHQEFSRWCDDRNLHYLRDNNLLSTDWHNSTWQELWDDRQTVLREHHRKLAFILLRDRSGRDRWPVFIGLPWETKIRAIPESEIEGEKAELAPLTPQGYAITIELAQRSIFVPKEGRQVPLVSKFYMPDVPSRDGIDTKASIAMIVRIHDPYKAVYNLRFWKQTLLNEVVPHVREAIGRNSWYAIAENLAEKSGRVDPKNLAETMLDNLNPDLRLALKLTRPVVDGDGNAVRDPITGRFQTEPWNIDLDREHKEDPLRMIDRYPDNNDGTLARVYRQYGIYVVDVKVQDVEPESRTLSAIQAITQQKFLAGARIQEAEGRGKAIERVGSADGKAIRARLEGQAEGVKSLVAQGVDPTRAAELYASMESAKSVGKLDVITVPDSMFGAMAGVAKQWASGQGQSSPKEGSSESGKGSSPKKPPAPEPEGTTPPSTLEGNVEA